jgi:hypothetical protein
MIVTAIIVVEEEYYLLFHKLANHLYPRIQAIDMKSLISHDLLILS